jgi:hypothetical protein
MSRDPESGGEWILLSMAIARMSELHPGYASYPGYARRDLERTIQAGRADLRGCWLGAPDSSPSTISTPITGRWRLNSDRNTIVERRPGNPSGETLYHSVQIEWTSFAQYIRDHAPAWLSAVRPGDAFGLTTSPKKKGRADFHKAIALRLKKGAQPGQDQSWKKFCDAIRDDANGWTQGADRRPKRGFSDKAIQRAASKLRKDK